MFAVFAFAFAFCLTKTYVNTFLVSNFMYFPINNREQHDSTSHEYKRNLCDVKRSSRTTIKLCEQGEKVIQTNKKKIVSHRIASGAAFKIHPV